MSMSFITLPTRPCVQLDQDQFRLAYINPVTGKEEILLHSDRLSRDRLERHQLHVEYVIGVSCWIQRKVVNHFNTFSTECWV
jgi:hypothetical protein